MKGLLILLLIAFVINADDRCKKSEFFSSRDQKCVKVCEDNERYNPKTSACELDCKAGEFYNVEANRCQPNEKCKDGELYDDKEKKMRKSM